MYTTLAYPRPSGSGYTLEPLSVLIGWAINTAGPIIYGDAHSVARLVLTFGSVPLLLASTVLLGLVALALTVGRSRERLMTGLFTLASGMIYAVCVGANQSAFFDYAVFQDKEWLQDFSFTRYAVVPTMFLLAVIPSLALSLEHKRVGSRPVILVGFAVFLATMFFIPGTNRDGGPVWSEQVEQSHSECDSGTAINAVIKVAPHFYDGDVILSCDLLVKHRSD